MVSRLGRCATFITDLRTGRLHVPHEVLDLSIECFVDTVAVMYSGLSEPVTRIAAAHALDMGGGGIAKLVAGGRTQPAWAAMANATAAHAQDFDDHSPAVIGGHVSAVVVPVVLALGEHLGASGEDVLKAFAAGFEIVAALARGVNPWHYAAGFHPTSTLGTFGAAAAASYLLNLDADQGTHALATAASMASGIKANFGTMVKPFHCGWAAFAGIQAAMLAQRGLRGNPMAYEHRQGFGQVYGGWSHGAQGADVEVDPGNPWFLEVSGMPLRKPWPCCGSIHTSIEAALRLREQHGLTAKDIEAVKVGVHPRRLPHTNRPSPTSAAEARFSNQFCVASALVHGSLTNQHFSERGLRDTDVQRVMERVQVIEDPRFDARDPGMTSAGDFGAVVEVRTRSGDVYVQEVTRLLGGADRPLPAGELERKFMECVSPVLGVDNAEAVLKRLMSMRSAADVRDILPFSAAVNQTP